MLHRAAGFSMGRVEWSLQGLPMKVPGFARTGLCKERPYKNEGFRLDGSHSRLRSRSSRQMSVAWGNRVSPALSVDVSSNVYEKGDCFLRTQV